MTAHEALVYVRDNGNSYAKSYANQAIKELYYNDNEATAATIQYVLANFIARKPEAKIAKQALNSFVLDYNRGV